MVKRLALSRRHKTAFLICTILIAFNAKAQEKPNADTTNSKTIVAGEQYNRSSIHQKLWGKHYRTEWNTPVPVPSFYLDTAGGGLIPYTAGGGRQTKTLRLRSANGKEYVLRSVDKTFDAALPPEFHNTFVEDILNDQVSIGHPYAALTIADMAEAAKVYHTWPQIVYVPKQPALDSFNQEFGDDLYLFEQRPDENWEEADNFGNSKKIISTEDLLEKLLDSNEHKVNQPEYVRARLFDIFLGDWGRHEDQWRWASFTMDDKTFYKPIPRDRDQAYTMFDGALVKLGLTAANASHLQSFKNTIADVKTFNFPARNLDRRFANEPSLAQWLDLVKELQQLLTNEVIESSVKKLPKEIFPISGLSISTKLKKRRDDLAKYAKKYYLFLAKEIEVVGSKQQEYFEVKRLNDKETQINVYKISKEGEQITEPIYSRIIKSGETKEVRLYGIAGNDIYKVEGEVQKGIKIRIIGGSEKDVIIDSSVVQGSKRLHIYDNSENSIVASSSTKLHLSNDTSIHKYKYARFKYDSEGRVRPVVFYGDDDRLFAGIGYKVIKEQWRKEPFGYQHRIYARYSITQKALSFGYIGTVTQFIGKWNLELLTNYDAVRWTNFYGIGNETKQETDDRDFYRMRTRAAIVSFGLKRKIGKWFSLGVNPFFQLVDIIRDEERFIVKNFSAADDLNSSKQFAGAGINLRYSRLNNGIIPTKGVQIQTAAAFTQNVQNTNKNFSKYSGSINFYLPLLNNLILAVRSGGATVTGKPEFYQLASIGGSETVRGYWRDRFWGKSSFYNSNELQWLFNVKSFLFNGKAGIVSFYDHGRVWQPAETSNTWHNGYGGGFIIAPFNKIMASVTYGISTENKLLHLKLSRNF